MPSLANDVIFEAEEAVSQPSSSKTPVFSDYLPVDPLEANNEAETQSYFSQNGQGTHDVDEVFLEDDVDTSTEIPELIIPPTVDAIPAEVETQEVMAISPAAQTTQAEEAAEQEVEHDVGRTPSTAARDAAALGAPRFHNVRNLAVESRSSVETTDWSSKILNDDSSVEKSIWDGIDEGPGEQGLDFQPGQGIHIDDFQTKEVPTLEEQMTTVARTLGVTLGLELEIAGNGMIGDLSANLPKGYPRGTSTFFVKEVFLAGAAYESQQVQPGDFITAVSSVPVEKVTIEFLSKRIRDFVGVSARKSVIDDSVEIPEIDGLPLHLGLLRLTGDQVFPDNALVFRAMLLKRLQAEMEAAREPEPEPPLLPGHSIGITGHAASSVFPDSEAASLAFPGSEAAAPASPPQPRDLGLSPTPQLSRATPTLTSYQRKVVPVTPVQASPMGMRPSPMASSPWGELSGDAAAGLRLPSTLTPGERERIELGITGVVSPFVVTQDDDALNLTGFQADHLDELGKMIDEELAAAMMQLETVDNDAED